MRTIEEAQVEQVEITMEEPAVIIAENEPAKEQPRKGLDNLMRKLLARRDEVRATQQKLRDIEVELRQAPTDKRSRFERMREAALTEYRNARTEAARTRHQLLSNLRMLPSRS